MGHRLLSCKHREKQAFSFITHIGNCSQFHCAHCIGELMGIISGVSLSTACDNGKELQMEALPKCSGNSARDLLPTEKVQSLFDHHF